MMNHFDLTGKAAIVTGTSRGLGQKKEVDPRMHSAEHILTATLVKMFGCARPFATHIEKKKSKADYYFSQDLTASQVQEIERAVNQVASADLPVREAFLTWTEAGKLYNLERVPEGAGDTVRIIYIGDYDACPCIGPHVTVTKEIGVFRIISTTFANGELRVRFKLDPPAG
jgi:misacylated tRNA(Ala) deacylase